jgi:hypothetical protein
MHRPRLRLGPAIRDSRTWNAPIWLAGGLEVAPLRVAQEQVFLNLHAGVRRQGFDGFGVHIVGIRTAPALPSLIGASAFPADGPAPIRNVFEQHTQTTQPARCGSI